MTRMAILTTLNEALHLLKSGNVRAGVGMLSELLEDLGQEEERTRNAGGFDK